MQMLLFFFRLGSLENTEGASEQRAAVGTTRKVMEENLSHELLRQDPNPNFLHVYGITTSENTSYLPPFLNPQLNVPFMFPFLSSL